MYIHQKVQFNTLPINVLILFFQELDVGRSTDIHLKTCEAYEVVKLSKQKVTMEVNPAYEQILPH